MKKKLLIIIILVLLINVSASTQGDVNLDGKVSVIDYIMVKNHILGITKLTGNNLVVADVNNDKKVSSQDYILIKKILINKNQSKEVTAVTIDKTSDNIKVGEKYQLTYTINPTNAEVGSVTWSVSNNKIASIDKAGVLTAKSPGTIYIGIETSNHKTSSISINVTNNVNVGIWFSTWYAYEDKTSTDVKKNTWKSWDIQYKPLLSNGSFGYYDTYNKNEAMYQLSSIASLGIDFLIFDQTNHIYTEEKYIYNRSVQMAKYIKEYNEKNVNKLYYCSAIGGVQWTRDGATIENEAQIIWDNFVKTDYGKYHYYYKGKPVLVIYGDAEELWKKYTGSKTYGNKFSIFFADNNSTSGYWGWAYDKGVQLNPKSIVVMPGWHNHYNRQVKRNNGQTYISFWEAVINYSYIPEFVIINSFNEYAEATAIWPADTSTVPSSKYGNEYDVWYNANGVIDPYYYWNLTKKYVGKIKSKT